MTEEQIKGLGYHMSEQYDHDQFTTNRYCKGVLSVEFTYESRQLLAVELTIEEIDCKSFTFEEIEILTTILGGKEIDSNN